MMRTGRVGKACAHTKRDTAGNAAAPAARCRNRRRWGSFILNLPSHHSITSARLEYRYYGSLDLYVGLPNDASVVVILRMDKGTKVGPALAHGIEPERQELRFDLGRVH